MPSDEEPEDEAERDDGIRFTLPPIRLPPLFPGEFRLRIPAAERPRTPVTRRRLLAAAALADLLDGALAVSVASPVPAYARALAVAVLGVLLVGRAGLLALWEVVVVALGAPLAAAAPTLTALLALDFLRLGDPEQVQGDAQREGEPPDDRE